jgi:restriction endonuclease S subunit
MTVDNWQSLTLGEFVRLQRGHDLTEAQRRPGAVPVFGSAGHNGYHDVALAPGPGVVVGRSGDSMGVVSYAPMEFWPHNTVLYVTDFLGNSPRFAYYFLGWLNLRRFDSGSAQASLNRNFVYPMPIKVPYRNEQEAIGSVLGTFDDKIELNRRMNETLEAMARAIFKDWLVDFGPTRAKMEGRAPYLAPDLWSLFPARLDDDGKPEGWQRGLLGDHITNFDSRRVPVSGAERAKRRGPFPYHGATGVMDHVDGYLFDGIFLLVGEDGSVVDTHGRAFTQYVWEKFWVNNHAHVLQGKGDVSTEHLTLYFKEELVAPFITGAVQLKLSQGRMNAMPFLYPGPEICKAFAANIAPLFAKLRANADEGTTLAVTRDLLLPKLMSGEVRVKDAERFTQGAA